MSRKDQAPKRKINPDPKYKDKTIAKFINKIMWDGKKSVAEKLFYKSLDLIQAKTNDDPLKVFRQALENVKPVLEVRSRRVGGANYQVPVEVRAERRVALAMTWIVGGARERNEKCFEECLAGELLDAINNRGAAIRRKEEMHKMAESNRAFSHFRW